MNDRGKQWNISSEKWFRGIPSGKIRMWSEQYFEEDAVGILASTPEKFSERFNALKKYFPNAEFLRHELEHGFVDVYVIKLNELYIERKQIEHIKNIIKEANEGEWSKEEAFDFIAENILKI